MKEKIKYEIDIDKEERKSIKIAMINEINCGTYSDMEEKLYPYNNDTEQTDAERLIDPDLFLTDCCSAFKDIEQRRFSKFENLNSEQIIKMINKESLPYEQFARLSDEDILKSSPLKLLDNVKHNNNENNYKLYTIVADHKRDFLHIQDSEFNIKYYGLRRNKNPKMIFAEYPKLVSEFDKQK